MLIKVASYVTVQGRFKRNRRKIFGGSGENETRIEKVRKKKEEMHPMQRGDRNYRRPENCENAALRSS